jgi:hypothetical protein
MTGVDACRSSAVSTVHFPSPEECMIPLIWSRFSSFEKAHYSKEIHLHITNNENSLGTINFYTENFFSSINNDLLEILKLVDLFTVLTSYSLNFRYYENTLASQKRLERNLDQRRLSIIQS